jgi:hypothetical protein
MTESENVGKKSLWSEKFNSKLSSYTPYNITIKNDIILSCNFNQHEDLLAVGKIFFIHFKGTISGNVFLYCLLSLY